MRHSFLLLFVAVAIACNPVSPVITRNENTSLLSLSQVAKIISELPLENQHLMEVYSAVESSTTNGYDEEYMMTDLFRSPGKGVGASYDPTKSLTYLKPLRELISDYFHNEFQTKAGESAADVELYLNSLEQSDIQIYWPYSEEWDGETFPIITFDPGYGVEENYGYKIEYDPTGYKVVDSVLVNEELAKERPVWVINTNDDSGFTPLVVENESSIYTKSSTDDHRSLYIENFQMLRNYDSWFGGASEFFIKCGAVNGFKATTDEDLKKYTPSVTDMMVVIKRNQIGLTIPIHSLLLSDFTDQMEKIAFLVVEDDGGKTTSWKASAVVKYKSKSTGFEVDIPYKEEDDIVWRGQLSRDFFGDKKKLSERFGDVRITFGLR